MYSNFEIIDRVKSPNLRLTRKLWAGGGEGSHLFGGEGERAEAAVRRAEQAAQVRREEAQRVRQAPLQCLHPHVVEHLLLRHSRLENPLK